MDLLNRVSKAGIQAGIVLSPLIPEVNDSPRQLEALFRYSSTNACQFLLLPQMPSVYSNSERAELGKLIVELAEKYQVSLRVNRHLPLDYRRENFRIANRIADHSYYRSLTGKPHQELHRLARFVNYMPVDLRNLVGDEALCSSAGLTPEQLGEINRFIITDHNERLPRQADE